MQLDLEPCFLDWIDQILRQRTEFSLDYLKFHTSIGYRFNLVFTLQMVLSDFELKLLVIHADFYCNCDGDLTCAYCLLNEVTQTMTVSAYLACELVDIGEIQQLI